MGEWVSVRELRIHALKNLLRQFNKWNVFSGHAHYRRSFSHSFAARVAYIFHLYIAKCMYVCVYLDFTWQRYWLMETISVVVLNADMRIDPYIHLFIHKWYICMYIIYCIRIYIRLLIHLKRFYYVSVYIFSPLLIH